ncbi:MAG TPA: hypothetical protein PK777_12190, partial [Thermoguttaceae bacterium]|nr:hypothetical protein [Thermoguttaceae bacterium]
MFAASRSIAYKTRNRSALLLVGFGLIGLLPALPAQAALLTWTGGTNADWNNTGNWNPAQIPTLTDEATFPATIPPTGPVISVPTGAQINNLTFNNSYTLQGGTLSFGETQQINVGAGLTVEISSSLLSAGVGANAYLKKVGTGTLILSGDNTGYNRWMDVTGGVVRVTANNAVPGGYFHVTNANAVVELLGGVTIPSGKTIYLSGTATTDSPSFRSVSGSNIWGGTLVLHNG